MAASTKKTIFLAVCVFIALLPLLAMFIFPGTPEQQALNQRNWLLTLSVALGFVGLSVAGLQFLPVAKIPWLADSLELDDMYHFHHVVSLGSVMLCILHPVLLVFNNFTTLQLFKFWEAPWTVLAGWIGLFALILIAFSSMFRKSIKLDYTGWVAVHAILASSILIFATIHLFKVNKYMSKQAMLVIWIAQIVIWVGIGIYLRVLKPLAIAKVPFVVEKVVDESPDTYSLYLKPEGEVKQFRAGQVAWISVGTQPFRVARNPFSYSGSDQASDGCLRFSIKELGEFTRKTRSLKPGDKLLVDGPYGTFDLKNPHIDNGLVMLAGGIGIAPMMSILHTMDDTGDKRPVWLFYGDFNENTRLFEEELADLESRLNLKVLRVLEKPLDADYPLKGYVSQGLLDSELPAEGRENLYYFMCGPIPMMVAMERILERMGIPGEKISTEKYEMA